MVLVEQETPFRLAPARPASPTYQALRPPSPPLVPKPVQWFCQPDVLDLRHRSLHYTKPYFHTGHRGLLEAQRLIHEAFNAHTRSLISYHALLLSRHATPSRAITQPLRHATLHLVALLAVLLPILNRLARTATEAAAVARALRDREKGRTERLEKLLERFEGLLKRWKEVEEWGETHRGWLGGDGREELGSALVIPQAPATKEAATRTVCQLCDSEWDLRSALHVLRLCLSSESLSSWSDALLYGGRSVGRIEGWLRVAEVGPALEKALRGELRELVEALVGGRKEREEGVVAVVKKKTVGEMPCGVLERWGVCACSGCGWKEAEEGDVYKQKVD